VAAAVVFIPLLLQVQEELAAAALAEPFRARLPEMERLALLTQAAAAAALGGKMALFLLQVVPVVLGL